jgi:hypothetical protein
MENMGLMELLTIVGDGRVLDDFHGRLDELIRAVKTSHKKGTLTLTLTVAPAKDMVDTPRVIVSGVVTAKIPQSERGSELFYIDDDDRLSRRNPRQPELPFNTVKMPPAEERADLNRKDLAAGEKA